MDGFTPEFAKTPIDYFVSSRTFACELSVVFAAGLVAADDTLDVLVLINPLRRSSTLRGVGARSRGHLELPETSPGAQ